MLELFLRRRPHILAIFAFFVICAFTLFRISPEQAGAIRLTPQPRHDRNSPQQHSLSSTNQQNHETVTQEEQVSTPPELLDSTTHPVERLMDKARKEFKELESRQSKSLRDAVKEYRRRYGIPPPPHFDKWFEFAQANGVQMVDEFNTIYEIITPFWGLKPKTIRGRAKEALGYDNGLLGVAIRDHKIAFVENGQKWQQNATVGMLEKFLQYLPDMDLAFNMHDEPRVVVPHDDLSRLVHKARTTNMPATNAHSQPVNDFTGKSSEAGSTIRFTETKQTRFNSIFRQSTWSNSRLSCSPDSPARTLEDDEAVDDVKKYALGDAGFIHNQTAMTDICISPSLRSTYGFFDRPNIYKITHDLFPVFSQSKISSYNDMIYPSPWYWYEKVTYNQTRDLEWESKQDRLYWRGSTTGGYSRNGGWRRQHRQQLVEKINAVTETKIFTNQGDLAKAQWKSKDVARGEYRDLIDVHFSHVGQCDAGDCDAQRQFFNVTDRVDLQDAWGYKYLLDMDGNAFSGRFYTFLQSRSQIFKQALFREWHAEWLKPWLHYVPLSMQGNDWLELVRYYSDRDNGAEKAKQMAEESCEWAGKALRKVDMEAWFFRLLLEYARVIDDQREIIGFDPASSSAKLPAA